MKAMVLAAPGRPLALEERPDPQPGPGEIRVRVEACAVCRTDLHVVDGELARTAAADRPRPRDRRHRRRARRRRDGAGASASASAFRGSATPAATAPTAARTREPLRRAGLHRLQARRRLRHPRRRRRRATPCRSTAVDDPVAAAPLLCAGLIGWRSLQVAGDGAAHRPLRLRRRRPHRRPGLPLAGPRGLCLHAAGDAAAQAHSRLARRAWAGGSDERRPSRSTRPSSSRRSARWCRRRLRAVRKGGRVVCGGIHMSDIPSSPIACCGRSGSSSRSPI